jgi:hypothetical protein
MSILPCYTASAAQKDLISIDHTCCHLMMLFAMPTAVKSGTFIAMAQC